MAEQGYILAIDPGATNTKGVLREYTPNGQIKPDIDEVYNVPSETETVHGMQSETAPKAMYGILKKINPEKRAKIKAISIVSHGATGIPVDASGVPVFGVVSYENECFDSLRGAFFDEFGTPEQLFLETGSAEYGLGINLAKQWYFLQKECRNEWEKVDCLLPLSSYMAFLLTGEKATTHTHMRNHGYVEKLGGEWSSVVRKMGIEDLFPKFIRPFDRYGTVAAEVAREYGLPADCAVVAPGHDTSATAELAPNYANTGSWICNTAKGVPIELTPDMANMGLVVNADVFGKNLITVIARLGKMRDAYRAIYEEKFLEEGEHLPQDVQFKALKTRVRGLPLNLPLAFMEGGTVYPSIAEYRDLPEGLTAGVLIHALSKAIAITEVLSSLRASDPVNTMGKTLNDLVKEGYEARPVGIGGNFVNDVGAGEGTFTGFFRRFYPGEVARFTFDEPTSYAAHFLAVCALEGKTPDDVRDRLETPTKVITFTGDRGPALDEIARWETVNGMVARIGKR